MQIGGVAKNLRGNKLKKHPVYIKWKMIIRCFININYNPREASSQPKIFLISLVHVCIWVFTQNKAGVKKLNRTRDLKEPLISIILSLVSSKPFSDWETSENSQNPGVFRKFPLIENFQNDWGQFSKNLFDRKSHTEKRYNGTILLNRTCEEIWHHYLIFNNFMTSCVNKMTYKAVSPYIFAL